jgi:hypothetical protein
MESSHFQKMRANLISLGFLFYGELPSKVADPEATLIQMLHFFYEDRKLFRMTLLWLTNVSQFIHVERLHKFCNDLDPKLIPIMGALSKKMILFGDRRFRLIYEEMKKMNPTQTEVPEGYADPFLISKYGEDTELKEFGIVVAKFEPEDSKKVLDLPNILKLNPWLKLRALIGANFRADLIWCLTQKAVQNPNQAAKALGCSRETAYRLWKEVSLFENLERLVA